MSEKFTIKLGEMSVMVECIRRSDGYGRDLELSFYQRIDTAGITKVKVNCVSDDELEAFVKKLSKFYE